MPLESRYTQVGFNLISVQVCATNVTNIVVTEASDIIDERRTNLIDGIRNERSTKMLKEHTMKRKRSIIKIILPEATTIFSIF